MADAAGPVCPFVAVLNGRGFPCRGHEGGVHRFDVDCGGAGITEVTSERGTGG